MEFDTILGQYVMVVSIFPKYIHRMYTRTRARLAGVQHEGATLQTEKNMDAMSGVSYLRMVRGWRKMGYRVEEGGGGGARALKN